MKRTPFSNSIGALLAAIGISGGPLPSFREASPGKRRKGRAAGMFGRGLIRAGNKVRAEAEVQRQKKAFAPRDEHGAVTFTGASVGGVRRVWLGGVSAQRGF